MHGLSSTTGVVALAAAAAAAIALILCVVALVSLRRVRAAQRVILGPGGQARDLVGHATDLTHAFEALRAYVEEAALRLEGRLVTAEDRIDRAVSYCGLFRYDAYNEMSGRQSTSIALLDATKSGIVLSSIHHRDQARLYTKLVREGATEIELSPEEAEAMRLALAGELQEAPE